MKDMELWLYEKRLNGWIMPRAAWWKRMPVIRRIRGAVALYRVHENASNWASVGIGFGGPSQFDKWVCFGISKGQERPAHERTDEE